MLEISAHAIVTSSMMRVVRRQDGRIVYSLAPSGLLLILCDMQPSFLKHCLAAVEVILDSNCNRSRSLDFILSKIVFI